MFLDLIVKVGFGFISEEFNKGRFIGIVGIKNGNLRWERYLERDVVELLDRRIRVLEWNVLYFE